ncbi:MAG TPA: hypothetical protein VMV92_35410 [Streptosporangiaceae bacterium]|nr:hypothetical protein [Streptosporangiaceae bacterium]
MTANRARVGDVLKLRRVPVAVDPAKAYEEIGLRSFGKGVFHKEPVSGASLGSKRVFEIRPGDLLLSNVFAWEGAIAVAGPSEDGRIGSHRYMTYVPSDGRIDAGWARYFFLSEPGLELVRKASPGSAGRNRTLGIQAFEGLEIPLPSIDEQRRIAGRLDGALMRARRIESLHAQSRQLRSALPFSVTRAEEERLQRLPTRMGDILEQVRDSVEIDPFSIYTTLGIRSFGKGIFHYDPRPGAEIGKLRFLEVGSDLLAISNIKAREGAVAVTAPADVGAVASNRFLFFRPRDGRADVRYLHRKLLTAEGLDALGRASPGPADRNRTLSVRRFEEITLDLPGPADQRKLGAWLERLDRHLAEQGQLARSSSERLDALQQAVMNNAFT